MPYTYPTVYGDPLERYYPEVHHRMYPFVTNRVDTFINEKGPMYTPQEFELDGMVSDIITMSGMDREQDDNTRQFSSNRLVRDFALTLLLGELIGRRRRRRPHHFPHHFPYSPYGFYGGYNY